MSITLGSHPTDVPEPFASLLRDHLAARPNLCTVAGPDSPWLFPSTLAGRQLDPNAVMDRLRDIGVNLLGARNRAIGELVSNAHPPSWRTRSATGTRSRSSMPTRPGHGPATPGDLCGEHPMTTGSSATTSAESQPTSSRAHSSR